MDRGKWQGREGQGGRRRWIGLFLGLLRGGGWWWEWLGLRFGRYAYDFVYGCLNCDLWDLGDGL